MDITWKMYLKIRFYLINRNIVFETNWNKISLHWITVITKAKTEKKKVRSLSLI